MGVGEIVRRLQSRSPVGCMLRTMGGEVLDLGFM